MRATEALEYITNKDDRELMTHYNPEDTEEAKMLFRQKEEDLPLFDEKG